jgi:hypothetical protein
VVRALSLEEDLRAEIEKWLLKAEEALEPVSARGEEGERFLANIAAYLSDCRYFLDKDDLIRAFEAVIWAWAWIEIGEDVGLLIRES